MKTILTRGKFRHIGFGPLELEVGAKRPPKRIKKWCPNKRHSHNSRKYLVVVRSKCTHILQDTYESICCLSQGYKIFYKLRNPDIWARLWNDFCTAQYLYNCVPQLYVPICAWLKNLVGDHARHVIFGHLCKHYEISKMIKVH